MAVEINPQSANNGGPLKQYDVEVHGHKTTLLLSDADAERRGLLKAKAAPAPKNKAAAAPKNKAAAKPRK
jgi:hypothetical protein